MSFTYSSSRPRILATGARGLVGTRVLPELEKSYEVFQTDKAPADPSWEKYQQADLTDFAQILPLMEDKEAVVHLAIASAREFDRDEAPADRIHPFDESTMSVGLQATHHVFEAARRAGVRKIVFFSSMTVLMGNRETIPYDEQTPACPLNLYACTKLFGEHLADFYVREYGMSIICLRLGQPYPIGDNKLKAYLRTTSSRGSVIVAFPDIAHAIDCALQTDKPFGLYPVTSHSAKPRIDLKISREIGYSPRYSYCEDGEIRSLTELAPTH